MPTNTLAQGDSYVPSNSFSAPISPGPLGHFTPVGHLFLESPPPDFQDTHTLLAFRLLTGCSSLCPLLALLHLPDPKASKRPRAPSLNFSPRTPQEPIEVGGRGLHKPVLRPPGFAYPLELTTPKFLLPAGPRPKFPARTPTCLFDTFPGGSVVTPILTGPTPSPRPRPQNLLLVSSSL